MRSFTLQFLAASFLVAKLAFAQGPPPPWAGKPGGPGQPVPGAVDPLASAHHWEGPLPGPISGQQGQFGNLPPGFNPFGQGGGNPGAAGGMNAMPPNGMPGAPHADGNRAPGPGSASGGLQLEKDYPKQPTQASMYTYVPSTFKKGNPLVVALHHCGGSAPAYFGENQGWTHAADQKGFMMIYANSPPGSNGCWDVSSEASLKHDGGGDSQSIVNMVKYAQQKYGCSEHQVYVVGHSSGAMLTQVLSATYPDVFLAATAISGVPAGCFRTERIAAQDLNTTCTGGALHESPDYWVKQAKNMYPVSAAFKSR